MKRRVCCLLLGLSILCLPAQQVYAAPAGPAAHEHPKPHEKEHEKLVPPHEKEHPKPHEKKKPHEEKKGPLAEKPIPPHEKEKKEAEDKQPVSTPAITPIVAPTEAPTATPKPTATPAPTAAPKPTATPAPTVAPKQEVEDNTTSFDGSELVKYALQFVGNPYKYGGTSLTNGADCSGFVQSVFAHFDYSLERTSSSQAKTAGYMEVSLRESDLQPGDLIFYANSRGSVYHVAIYIGDGKIVHASNNRKEITISAYNCITPYKARRVVS